MMLASLYLNLRRYQLNLILVPPNYNKSMNDVISMNWYILLLDMVQIGYGDVLSLAQTIGIVGTLILTLYFPKRQIQSLSIDQQSRVLNDLDEKIRKTTELMLERPSLRKVMDNIGLTASDSEQYIYSYYILSVWSHAYAMRQRALLNDSEWRNYIQWMRNAFQRGTINERWKQIESDRWLDPAFQNFINTEIIGASGIST
jgi:hypothetical protein